MVHRRNELGFLPARAIIARPLLRKAYTRDAYAPLLHRGTGWVSVGHIPRPQTEPHLQKPFQSAAKALQTGKILVSLEDPDLVRQDKIQG